MSLFLYVCCTELICSQILGTPLPPEAKRYVGVNVRIRQVMIVSPLTLVNIFLDTVHQQRLLVLLRDDHEADGIDCALKTRVGCQFGQCAVCGKTGERVSKETDYA